MRSEKWLNYRARQNSTLGWRYGHSCITALIEGLSPLPSADENLRLEIEEKAQNLVGQYFIKNYKN